MTTPVPRNHCLCEDTDDFTLDQRNATKPPAPHADYVDHLDQRARGAFLRAWAERQVRLSDQWGSELEVVAPDGYEHQECCDAICNALGDRTTAEDQASRRAALTCVPSLRGTALAALAALWSEVEAWCGTHPASKWWIGAGIGGVGGALVGYLLALAMNWLGL